MFFVITFYRLSLCQVKCKLSESIKSEQVKLRFRFFIVYPFCLDTKRVKKVKAKPTALQALPGHRTFSIDAAFYYFGMGGWR